MLQDAPNHRGAERRGYGIGGNVKWPAAQTRRPNKGHIGYGSGENETELDWRALYRALSNHLECSLLLRVFLIYAHFNLVGINSGCRGANFWCATHHIAVSTTTWTMQYTYSGHVIKLPQDIASFANALPRLPSELDMIVVWKEGAANTHHDFRVRRGIVLHALQ